MEKESKRPMYNIGNAGKQPGINMRTPKLYAFLKEHNVIHSDNKPFQEYVEKGLFRHYVKVQPWNRKAYNVTLVTADGLNFIRRLIKGGNL